MRALVVDDEAPARRRLIRMLEPLGVQVIGEAQDGLEALKVVDQTQPDLIFLDIRMPNLDGLALAAQYAHLPPVVFVTAFEEHAIEAFDVNAVDYLLKPVRQERLRKTLERIRTQTPSAQAGFEALAPPAPEVPRVVVHDRNTTHLFDAPQITRFWSSNKYTVFQHENVEHLTNEPLSALEERLTNFGFMRVHRAELIRIDAVASLRAADAAFEVELIDGQVARVSRRSITTLKRHLGLSS